jgi:glycosyltransferase involved in cell wall biosynthesis
MVRVYNTLKAPNKIEEVLLAPKSWGEVPLADALRYKQCPGLVFDWRAVETGALDKTETSRHISFLSPFNIYDGYGLVGVHTVQGLEQRGFTVHISNREMPFYTLLSEQYPEVAKVCDRETTFTKWGIAHHQPPAFDKVYAARRIGWTMWEATRLPKAWLENISLVERLIVPTKGQLKIFRESGVKIPIDVVPDGIDFSAYQPVDRPDRPFTFITWGRLSSRKCPMETASCFIRAFPKEQYPNVRMVFKTREGNFGGGAGGGIPSFSDQRIQVIDASWELPQLVQFCHGADAAIFLSHGEGFGQPAVQAMATGLPVVLSNHSGQSDFCDERYNYPVGLDHTTPHVPSPLGADYGEEGIFEWWENDYSEAIERMREVYHNRDRSTEKGKRASEWVRKRFSTDAMCDGLAKLLKRLD